MSLILYLLQVTFSMAIFYGFYHFALRRETLFEVNRVYLLTTMLFSLALPFVHLEIAPDIIQHEVLSSVVLLETSVTNFTQNLSSTLPDNITLKNVFLTIYKIGVIVMVLRFLFAYRQIHRIQESSTPFIIQGSFCLLSDMVNAPFSFFNTIYLPLDHNYKEIELAEIIAHEKAHVQKRHSWDVLLMEVVSILCWINPFIYLYKNSLSDVHEYIADKAVLNFSKWENYAQLLVRQQYRQVPNALSHQLIYSQLKNRLRMMTKQPSGISARLKYLGFIPALLISVILFSFTYQDSRITSEENQYNVNSIVGEENDLPLFPGCVEVSATERKHCTSTKLNEYIGSNLVFPKSLKAEGVEGKVIAKFTVGGNGQVKDASIVKSLHADADLAVLNLIIDMNDKVGSWMPATKDGKAVDAVMHLPVVFEFDKE